MLVKHKDLSIQQVTKIARTLLAHARLEKFWGRFTRHQTNEEGYSEVSWRKLNYNNLTTADLKDLEEGHTPDPTKLSYSEFKCTVADFGNWIPYTDKSKKYNFDDVVRDAKSLLADDLDQQKELRIARQFYMGTATVTAKSTFLETLLKAKTILKKNKAKPVVDGKYVAIIPDEIANDVLVAYEKSLTNTTEKNAIIEGYIGCLGGFIIYSRTEDVCYKNSETGYCLFMGKSVNGLPVGTVSIGEANASVYDNGLGSVPEYESSSDGKITVKPDALHQRGSVGYKVMGFGTRIIDDEAILRCEMPLVKVTEGAVAEEGRQHFVRTSESPVAE